MKKREKKTYLFKSSIEAVWKDIVDYEDPRKYDTGGKYLAMERIETISPTEFNIYYDKGFKVENKILERVEQSLYRIENRVVGPEGAKGSSTIAELRVAPTPDGGTRLTVRRAMECTVPMFVLTLLRKPKDTYQEEMKKRLGEL